MPQNCFVPSRGTACGARFRSTQTLILTCLVGFAAAVHGAAPERWPTTVDVDPGETVTAVRGGVSHTFRILSDAFGQPAITHDTMPFPTTSVDKQVNYAARVRMVVDGQQVEVVARPFQYPIEAAGLRLYLDGTQEWLAVGLYGVALPKRIRLRFTAARESWGPATLRFPVGEYRWYSSSYNNTWLGIVPQGVETTYYHKGEDFGAVPDRLPVFAPEAGTVTTSEGSVQFTAQDGTITRMFHMNPPNVVVAAGQLLEAGQRLGLTGQYGNGNSDPHLHYDFRWDRDEPGTYPFAADAYLRDYPDAGIPVAGGYQFMFAGDTLTLDGRRSLARPGRTIIGYRWILHDGTVIKGPTAPLSITVPGFYSEELRVFFDDGREERGFTAVRAFARDTAWQMPITGFVYQYPVRGITPGSEVTIGHYPFGEGSYERTIDFGDGSQVETVLGWQPTVGHAYATPGLYTVTIRTIGGLAQVLKTSVLVATSFNHEPVIDGPDVRQWHCVAGGELVVSLVGTDPDGDPVDWTVTQAPAQGTTAVGPDGVVRYVPAAGFVGDDAFTITLADDRGGSATVRGEVAVRAVPYAAWIASYFPDGTAAQTDPTADPDGDGVANLLEYGLGRSPDAAEPPLAPTLWTDHGTGSQYLALTFKRARGATVVAEISDDLVTWSSAAADLVQVGIAAPDPTGLYETVTFRSTGTTTAKPRQFLRVRVTAP